MYNAKIEAHDLTRISTEPRLIKELETDCWNELQEKIRVIIDANMYQLHNYSITVSYHKADY